jgi:AraC family transcriptional regulator of adaptative response / DNA-3-methyladenine glycosylase II
VRTPFAGSALLGFLAPRAVPGVETVTGSTYARTLRLPHGIGTVELELADHLEGGTTAFVPATFHLDDVRDLASAVERARRLIDADCDPVAIADTFAGDGILGPLVRQTPGLRVPGHVDGDELAVRAVLGQQVTVAAARTAAGRLAAQYGEPLAEPRDGLTHLFPSATALAAIDPESLPMPRARAQGLLALCQTIADGDVRLDRGADRDAVRRRLLEIPGIGPWTADYIALRALGHPDVFLPTDIGVRNALRLLGHDPSDAAGLAEAWRPWRSYAQLHLWQTLTPAPKGH